MQSLDIGQSPKVSQMEMLELTQSLQVVTPLKCGDLNSILVFNFVKDRVFKSLEVFKSFRDSVL